MSKITLYERDKAAKAYFKWKRVAFVGKFNKIDRADASKYLWNIGACVNRGIVSETNIAIIGALMPSAKYIRKLAEAKVLNNEFIEISEDEFLKICKVIIE